MQAAQNMQSYEYTAESSLIPYVSIPDLLKEKSYKFPNKEPIICYSKTGKRFSMTYSELYVQSDFFAKYISTLGYERGSIIAIETKNTPEWLICTFGSQMAGLVPLHFAFGKPNGEDIVAILNGVEKCVAIICDKSSTEVCKQFCENITKSSKHISSKIKSLQSIFFMNEDNDTHFGHNKLIEIGQTALTLLPSLSADDICAIFLTSGSTGNAKAVPYTHRKLLQMGFNWYTILDLQPGEKFYNYFPFGWLASYPVTFLTHEVTQVTLTDLRQLKSIEEINKLTLKVLDSEICISAIFLAPGICDLIKQDMIFCKSFPLRVICTTGLPVDAICAQIISLKTKTFAVEYGLTELGCVCVRSVQSPDDYESYAVGKPLPGVEVKILNDKGGVVPRSKSGEIYIRTRDRFLGYKNAPNLICDDRGWYRSDDIGYMTQDGGVVVTGRKSEMMIISNDIVSPAYLEGILKEHESVLNAFVYPIYNQESFHKACAAILLRKDKTATEEELKDFITQQKGRYAQSFLATRHVPQIFLFYHSFPATHSGKLDRKTLAISIMEKLGIK